MILFCLIVLFLVLVILGAISVYFYGVETSFDYPDRDKWRFRFIFLEVLIGFIGGVGTHFLFEAVILPYFQS